MAELEERGRAIATAPGDCRIKEEPPDDIKDYAETTMNELLGWYGYDKVDSRDTQGLNLQHFAEELAGSSDNSSSREALRNGACSPGGPRLTPDGTEDTNADGQEDLLPGGCILCAWCQKVGMKLFTLKTATGSKAFCSEICFTQCRRASFKKNKVCDWCKHVRHTVNYVDFQDGEQQLQFCSDKCLNQYKMNIFCRETQAHLQLHPHLKDSIGGTKSNLITPELWLKDCKTGNGENVSSDDESLPENLSVNTSATPPTPPPQPPVLPPLPLPPPALPSPLPSAIPTILPTALPTSLASSLPQSLPPQPPPSSQSLSLGLSNPFKEMDIRHQFLRDKDNTSSRKPHTSRLQLPTRDRPRRPGRKHHQSSVGVGSTHSVAPLPQPRHRRRSSRDQNRELNSSGRDFTLDARHSRSPSSSRRSTPLMNGPLNGFAPPLPPPPLDGHSPLRPPFPPPGLFPNQFFAQQQMEAFLRLHLQRPPGMGPLPPGLFPHFPFNGLNQPNAGPQHLPSHLSPALLPPPRPPQPTPPAPPIPPPAPVAPQPPTSPASSLLPPVTVFVPYPIPIPIPVPIPLVLPIPIDFLIKCRQANGLWPKTPSTKCNSSSTEHSTLPKPNPPTSASRRPERTSPDDLDDDLLDEGHTSDASSGLFPDGLSTEDDLSDDDSDLDEKRTSFSLKKDADRSVMKRLQQDSLLEPPKKKGSRGQLDL